MHFGEISRKETKRERVCKMEARKGKTDTWRRRTAESESRPRALAVYCHADRRKSANYDHAK